ncbi:MAG: ABC transporter ATP-binding protein [Rickettsiaceae bacterium]|nr:MAG: ABC transporter ATP-binding protein [Rickettsiaceae bacterium]
MYPAIEIKSLNKSYLSNSKTQPKLALQELDLSIPQGSTFALLGPNGAGKSTLINIIAGTAVKTCGLISIMGVNIDLFPKLAKTKIGIVPQEIVIDTFFTIYQTLEFAAGYYGIRKNARRTEELLKILGLWEKRGSLPGQLSGGMKRRFLIAKAMVHSPQVLILDEPSAGVDLDLREQLWNLIKKLNSEGTTIVITTHYLAEAEELCDQVAFINNGKIIKQDSKNNLFDEFGSRCIEVEFDNDNFASLLSDVGLKFDLLANNKVSIAFNHASCSLDNLLANFRNANLVVKNIESKRADFETIFKKVINSSI